MYWQGNLISKLSYHPVDREVPKVLNRYTAPLTFSFLAALSETSSYVLFIL